MKRTDASTARKSKVVQPPYNLFEENQTDKTFQDGLKAAINLLKGRKNVVVLCGAGISVSCGIPDFRSKGGIYNMIDINEFGLCTPEEIFHYEVFQDDPRPFYKFAGKMLYPDRPHQPSPSHRFLAMLEEKKQLLRVYTQNIDGLEEKAGVSSKKVVNAHGSLKTSKCLKCGGKVDSEELREEVLKGNVPLCQRVTGKRKRRRDEIGLKDENGHGSTCTSDKIPVKCDGVMKPNITFFGEPLTDRVRRCLEADQSKADAVIVMGTSLSVAPISKVIKYLRPSIPRLLINRTIVIPKHTSEDDENDDDEDEEDHRDAYLFDALFLGFCDEVTKALTYVMTLEEKKDAKQNKKTQSFNKKKSLLFPFQSEDCEMLCNEEADKLGALGNGNSCLFNHPSDRILMFPGAKLESRQDDELSYHEVVHCDECHSVIKSKIMKCADCFDYDLCTKCFSASSKKHHEGKHKFIEEKIS